MTVTVFVWNARGSGVGHASMATTSPKSYISWWPDSAGLLDAILVRPSKSIKMANITTDMLAEGDGKRLLPDYASAPINGLDEATIVGFWDSYKSHCVADARKGFKCNEKGDDYQLLLINCSTIVLNCLKAGGVYKKFPKTVEFTSQWNVVTPGDIRQLADLITGFDKPKDAAAFRVGDHLRSIVV